MTWLQRYRLRSYLRNSIWVLPAIALCCAGLLVRLIYHLDQAMGWQSRFDADTVRTVLGTLAGSIFTFIVFICSSLLLVVQLASAQLSPRIIGILFRDHIIKVTLAIFVFTFAFCMSALVRVGPYVPPLTVDIAALGAGACLAVFLYLIDHVGKLLRPSGALRTVAVQAHEVIGTTYPRRRRDRAESSSIDLPPAGEGTVVPSRLVGVVLAFDVAGLVALAKKHACLIELLPQVGDFVAPGDPLFRVYGATADLADALHQAIALGSERTFEQDPAFAFRVIVDVAAKGLSPAINDPTTAVLAIDRIHHLLRHVGSRCLDDERIRDAEGHLRLIYRTPNWEDFVTLAVTEIRQFGATSIQVARRLRAMLEDLVHTLPAERTGPLEEELAILKRTSERSFSEPEDRVLAEASDSQGVGGASDERRRPRRNGHASEASKDLTPAARAATSTSKEATP
jgi:uncharacterized membrane protein